MKKIKSDAHLKEILSDPAGYEFLTIPAILTMSHEEIERNKSKIINFISPGGVFSQEIAEQLFDILLAETDIDRAMAYVVRCREVIKAMKRARKEYTFHEIYLILSIDDGVRKANK